MTVELPSPAVAKRLELRFQGGFAGKECVLMAGNAEDKLTEIQRFYPEDSNSIQVSFTFIIKIMIVTIVYIKSRVNT